MGNTSIEYHGRKLHASEGNLGMVMYLVGRGGTPRDPKWLREMRADWLWQSTSDMGYGLVDNLESWAANPARVTRIRRALRHALRAMSEWPHIIPGAARSAMSLHGGGPPEHYADWPAEEVRAFLRSLIALLSAAPESTARPG